MKSILAMLAFVVMSNSALAANQMTPADNVIHDGKVDIVIFQHEGRSAFCLQVPKKYNPDNGRVGCFADGDDFAFNTTANGNLMETTWNDAKDDGTEICYVGDKNCKVPAILNTLLDPKQNKQWGPWRP